MYILLSGRYPFKGATKEALHEDIRKEPANFLTPAWRQVSRDAKRLLQGLLWKQPARRATVSDALAHPWLANKASEPPRPTERGDDFVNRSWFTCFCAVSTFAPGVPAQRMVPEPLHANGFPGESRMTDASSSEEEEDEEDESEEDEVGERIVRLLSAGSSDTSAPSTRIQSARSSAASLGGSSTWSMLPDTWHVGRDLRPES